MDAASLVSAWDVLVLQLAATFTSPTAQVWRQITLGWVLHHKPAVTTGIIRVLGDMADRTWTVYHKFFYRAQWSLDNLCAQLLIHAVEPMLIEAGRTDRRTGKPIADLNIDDTTAARYGKHVAHAGWFKDASASGIATKGTVIHWAHNWILGAVTLRLPAWPAGCCRCCSRCTASRATATANTRFRRVSSWRRRWCKTRPKPCRTCIGASPPTASTPRARWSRACPRA